MHPVAARGPPLGGDSGAASLLLERRSGLAPTPYLRRSGAVRAPLGHCSGTAWAPAGGIVKAGARARGINGALCGRRTRASGARVCMCGQAGERACAGWHASAPHRPAGGHRRACARRAAVGARARVAAWGRRATREGRRCGWVCCFSCKKVHSKSVAPCGPTLQCGPLGRLRKMSLSRSSAAGGNRASLALHLDRTFSSDPLCQAASRWEAFR